MYENRHSAIALPMAGRADWPLRLNGVKLSRSMKKSPIVDIASSGRNLTTDVHSWICPMLRMPRRLIAAAAQMPARVSTIVPAVPCPVLTKRST